MTTSSRLEKVKDACHSIMHTAQQIQIKIGDLQADDTSIRYLEAVADSIDEIYEAWPRNEKEGNKK